MRIPDAPAGLLLAIAPTLATISLVAWRTRGNRRITPLLTTALALGIGLAALVIAVGATYAFRFFWPLRASNWLMAAPAAAYLAVLVTVGVKARVDYGFLGVWAVAGFAPLWYLGLYAWLVAACSFGDCL